MEIQEGGDICIPMASLIAQLVKNLPTIQETPVWFLGCKIHWRRDRLPTPVFLGFPCGLAVKNLPAMWETWVWFLGWEDPLGKEKVTHSSILAGEFHGQRSLVGYSPWGRKELDTTEQLSLSWLIHVDVWQKSNQYYKPIINQLKINIF